MDGVPLGDNIKRAKRDFRSAAAFLEPLATRTAQRPPLNPSPPLMEDEEPGPSDGIFGAFSGPLSPPPTPPVTFMAPEFVPGSEYHLTDHFSSLCGPCACDDEDSEVDLDIPEWYYRTRAEVPGTAPMRKKRKRGKKPGLHGLVLDRWSRIIWHALVLDQSSRIERVCREFYAELRGENLPGR